MHYIVQYNIYDYTYHHILYTIYYLAICHMLYTICYILYILHSLLYTLHSILHTLYSILFFAVLYCTVLYCALLYYAILCYTMLYYAILCYTMLYYAILCYTMLHYAILCYTMLYYAILCYTMLYCAMLFIRYTPINPMITKSTLGSVLPQCEARFKLLACSTQPALLNKYHRESRTSTSRLLGHPPLVKLLSFLITVLLLLLLEPEALASPANAHQFHAMSSEFSLDTFKTWQGVSGSVPSNVSKEPPQRSLGPPMGP